MRAQGLSFDLAWKRTWFGIGWSAKFTNTTTREDWREAMTGTKESWRGAYEGVDGPEVDAYAVLAVEDVAGPEWDGAARQLA